MTEKFIDIRDDLREQARQSLLGSPGSAWEVFQKLPKERQIKYSPRVPMPPEPQRLPWHGLVTEPIRGAYQQAIEPLGALMTGTYTDFPRPLTEIERAQYHRTVPWYEQIAAESVNPLFWAGPGIAAKPLTAAAARLPTRMGAPLRAGAELAVGAERVMAAPITVPAAAARKTLAYAVPRVGKWAPKRAKLWHYDSIEVHMEREFKPTWGREKIGEPLAKGRVGRLVETVDPRLGVQEEVGQRAFVANHAIDAQLKNQLYVVDARLQHYINQHGGWARLWNAEQNELGNWVTTLRDGRRIFTDDVIQFAEVEGYALTKAQKGFRKLWTDSWVPLRQHLNRLGVDLEDIGRSGIKINDVEGLYWPRPVSGYKGEEFGLRPPTAGIVKEIERSRAFRTAVEGNERGFMYEANPAARMDRTFKMAIDRIKNAEIAKGVEEWALKPSEVRNLMAPRIDKAVATRLATVKDAQHLVRVATDAGMGKRLAATTLAKVERNFPQLGARLRGATAKEAKAITKEGRAILKEAQASHQQVKTRASAIMAKARRGGPVYEGELERIQLGQVAHPALANYFFYPAEREALTKALVPGRVPWPLASTANLATMLRTTIATLDLSVVFIQGLYVLGRRPDIWAKTTLQALRGIVDPKKYTEYLAKNFDDIIERTSYGGSSQIFEMVEAKAVPVWLAERIPGRAGEMAAAMPKAAYGRAEAFFGGWGEIARNELWKSWRGSAGRTNELAELARLLDRMTGVLNTAAMGVGPSQRALENLLFFAPRYTRASLAFIRDMFRNPTTITGREALRGIGQTVMGGLAMYVGSCYMMGQEPKLDPSKGDFMTIEIDKNRIGIGGMVRALVRLGGTTAACLASKDAYHQPLDVIMPGIRANPLGRWFFSRTSIPARMFIEGIITHRGFLGEPIETPEEYARYLGGEAVVPIAFQSLLEQYTGEAGLAGRAIPELFGGMAYPTSINQQVKEKQEQYAQEEWGKPWEELDRKQQDYVRYRHDDLASLEEQQTEWRQERYRIQRY